MAHRSIAPADNVGARARRRGVALTQPNRPSWVVSYRRSRKLFNQLTDFAMRITL